MRTDTDINSVQKFTFPTVEDSSDYDPSWSPLGNEIIFQRHDKNIYRKGVPGSADTSMIIIYAEPTSIAATYPTVSTDGDSVVFTRTEGTGFHLFTIPIAGGTRRTLTAASGVYDRYGKWSPDSKMLEFERRDNNVKKVYKLKPADGNPFAVQFYAPSGLQASLPSYSPDSLVTLCAQGTLADTAYVVTTLETAVANPVGITSNYPAYLQNYQQFVRMSPDGTRLAVVAKDPRVRGATQPQIWVARRNMNLPPQFTNIGSHAVADSSATVTDAPTVGQNFTFTVAASDPEGDALTYDAYFLQEGMTFTPSTRTFAWTPPQGTVGQTFHVKFVVRTGSGGTDAIIDKMTVQACCGLSQRPALEEAAIMTGLANPMRERFVVSTPFVAGAGARLSVLDVSGRRVASVVGRSGGVLVWDGRDASGARAPRGLYLYRVEVGRLKKGGKVVLLQ